MEHYLETNFYLSFTILRENLEIRALLLRTRPSYKGYLSDNHSSFSQLKDSVHGFATLLQNGIFLFPSTIEILMDVEHNLENNI